MRLYFVYIASCAVSCCLGQWYWVFFNVNYVKTDVVNLSKKPGPKKKEKGKHFDQSKRKELGASDKGSWFDQFHILQLPEKSVPVA